MSTIFLNKEKLIRPIWIFISAFLVLSIRFNRQFNWIVGIIGKTRSDDIHYEQLTSFFRDGFPELISAPFSYRMLIPYLASLLPFDELTSINLLNACAFVTSTFLLQKLLKETYCPINISNSLLIAFIFSFPAFYYATIGYLDTWLVLMAISIIYIMRSNLPYFGVFIFIIIGTFIKESVIVFLPFIGYFIFQRSKSSQTTLVFSLITIGLWFLLNLYIRNLAPTNTESYFWTFSWHFFQSNIERARLIPALSLSLGIQGFWFIFLLLSNRVKFYHPFAIGFLSFITLWCYALFSAYADGRFIWPAMVFSTLGIAHYYSSKTSSAIQKNAWM